MLSRREPPDLSLRPDDELEGKCMTCGTVVKMARYKARQPRLERRLDGLAFGQWTELPSTECPECKATILLLDPNKRPNH